MRGRRPILRLVDGSAMSDEPDAPGNDIAAPPEHLPESAHADWNTVCADLRARGLLNDAALAVVAVYVTALWTVASCREQLAADGFFVETKQGHPKPHPATGLLSKNTEIVARLAAELGLTPSARQRKGLSGPPAPNNDHEQRSLGF